MINRILIRIKVVQLLYSYLLTRSEFRIITAPERNTRDSRYAYTFYIQTLLLILKLSGQKYSPADRYAIKYPAKNPVAGVGNALASNTELREISVRRSIDLADFEPIMQYLMDKVAAASIFQEYSRKRNFDLNDEVTIWCALLESVLAKDVKLQECCRKNEDFTFAGFERGIAMAVDTLRNYNDSRSSLISAKKSLQDSLDKAHALYIGLLMLPLEITRMREEQIESAKDKYLPSADDLNPNTKFVNNSYVAALTQCADLEKYFTDPVISSQADYFLVKKLLEEILESDIYKKYMASPTSSPSEDCEFWRDVMKDIIIPNDELDLTLENKSIYWNDDLAIIGGFVLKTIRKSAVSPLGCMVKPMQQFKDDEDAAFGEKLFALAVDNQKNYRELIDMFINPEQWDTDRIALMDIVIITAALAEMLNFPLIPVPVSMNEYVEIANFYSNPHSGQFINGILYAVISKLRDEGKFHKEF